VRASSALQQHYLGTDMNECRSESRVLACDDTSRVTHTHTHKHTQTHTHTTCTNVCVLLAPPPPHLLRPDTTGLHLSNLPAEPPANLSRAFVFRAHLDGSTMGFLLLDGPHEGAVRGQIAELGWSSGGDSEGAVTLEYRRAADR
jgi:hypothetical protein